MKGYFYIVLSIIPFSFILSQNIPYPESERFDSIVWHWETYYHTAPGSDLWPVTWDVNGHVQTSWGDGGGFDGDNIIGRVSLGFARIEGTPTDLQPHHNVWGGYNALNPATFEGKCESMISVNGILYGWLNTQNNPSSDPPDFKIIWSTDLAATWSLSDWSFPSNDTFFPFAFLNFGMDNSGARDEFVYSYGGRWIVTQGQENNIYLMRVHKNQILNRPDYQFFTGLDNDGNALWSYNINDRQSMFNDSNGITGNPSVIYNPDLGIYILTVSHGGIAKLGVFTGTEPWGPWETLGYYDNWGGFDNSIGMGLAYNIPTKWISEDGKTMWVIFSSENFLDRFNIVMATLYESPLQVEIDIPYEFNLDQNYPNPFNPSTKIKYSIGEYGSARINIYNINGEIIKELVSEFMLPGNYEILWDGKNNEGAEVSSGVYFYELFFIGSTSHHISKKMLMIK